jgi:hypothetical protein
MDEASIIQYITDTFDDVQLETADGNTFFFYGDDHKMPFVTLVTNDAYETVSDLNRPGIFRLNIGVSKTTFRSLFGETAKDETANGETAEAATAEGTPAYDFTALDTLMPHPVYGMMYWICA